MSPPFTCALLAGALALAGSVSAAETIPLGAGAAKVAEEHLSQKRGVRANKPVGPALLVKRCEIALVRHEPVVEFPGEGGSVTLAIESSGSSGCAKASLSDNDWVTVDNFGDSQVTLTSRPNMGKFQRSSKVTLVPNSKGVPLILVIKQAPVPEGEWDVVSP